MQLPRARLGRELVRVVKVRGWTAHALRSIANSQLRTESYYERADNPAEHKHHCIARPEA